VAVTLYVGNLPWKLTEDELADALRAVAQVQVHDVRIITDPDTGRSRGFGFVELEGIGLQEAIRAMEGVEVKGRRLTVGPARPRPQRS
jgi:RNA recognition motif-containing protein